MSGHSAEPWPEWSEWAQDVECAPGMGREESVALEREKYDLARAAVNALAGRDPAALEVLVEAARKVADWDWPGIAKHGLGDDAGDVIDEMRAPANALAAFEGEGAA